MNELSATPDSMATETTLDFDAIVIGAVRIPVETCHQFRLKPATDSGLKAATDSGGKLPP